MLRIYRIDVLRDVSCIRWKHVHTLVIARHTGLNSLHLKIPPWDLSTGQAIRNGFGQKEGLGVMNMVPSESSSILKSIHDFPECLDAAISDYLILKWAPLAEKLIEYNPNSCWFLIPRYFVIYVPSQWCYLSVYPF